MDEIGKRLKWARERAGFKTASDAARAFGWKPPTYMGHENGDRNPSRDKAKKYGRAFKVRWEWILEGQGEPSNDSQAPVVGYVGAGAQIFPVDDNPVGQGMDEASVPPGAPIDVVAVKVRGDSMYPRYFDGELVYYHSIHQPPSELIGKECVVKLADGRMLIKRLRRGTLKNVFNLESWNSPLLENAEIEWAAPVLWRG